jgi:hypothetical protein
MPATPRSRRRRRLLWAGGLLAICILGVAGVQSTKAARAAIRGKAALVKAEAELNDQRLDAAAASLSGAKDDFTRSRSEIRRLEQLLPFSRAIPLIGTQIRGVAALADSGVLLSEAGLRLTAAASVIVDPQDEHLELHSALAQLREVQGLLRIGVNSIDLATAQVDTLDGKLLIRPLGRARTELAERLPDIRRRAVDAADGLGALITFAGGDGPRRYLVLSQNPDELRPTGGYIGTYGVLAAEGGKLSLEAYDAIENWYKPRPDAVATRDETGSPLRFDTRLPQTLANVNTGPNWPDAAELATRLWTRGGEAPVQGVVSFSPAFLGRILRVIGPVQVESFGETISADNVVERLDYYTHLLPPEPGTDRKEFVAELAKTLMPKLFDAQASQWEALAKAMGEAFGSREAMIWSADPYVATVLAQRKWDGSVPATTGDFVLPAEFEYANKNGRKLRRSYDHHVEIRPDGSARVTTVLTLDNPIPPSDQNLHSVTYVTMYGPTGAVLGEGSDSLGIPEKEVAGHPAVGWVRPVEPQSKTTLKVVWEVPSLLVALADGDWGYSLLWMGHPDHTGDVANLSFQLPAGWSWKGPAPPAQASLDADIDGRWTLTGG